MDLFSINTNNQNGWIDLYYYENDFNMIFYAEKKIIENSEKYISSLKEELKAKVEADEFLQKKPTNENEESYHAQYYEHYYGDSERISNQIFQNQRKASILSIYSLIEGHLKILCSLIQSEFNFKIKLNDLGGGDDLQKYWNYLNKVYEIDQNKIERFFTPIKQLKYFRNKIAHNNSIIEADKILVVKKTQGLNVITYSRSNELEINNPVFITNLLKYRDSLFNNLIKEINNRYIELKKI